MLPTATADGLDLPATFVFFACVRLQRRNESSNHGEQIQSEHRNSRQCPQRQIVSLNLWHHILGQRRASMVIRNFLPFATACAAVAVLGISACAAATPAFNPDSLQEAQLSRVTQVCENVMGL